MNDRAAAAAASTTAIARRVAPRPIWRWKPGGTGSHNRSRTPSQASLLDRRGAGEVLQLERILREVVELLARPVVGRVQVPRRPDRAVRGDRVGPAQMLDQQRVAPAVGPAFEEREQTPPVRVRERQAGRRRDRRREIDVRHEVRVRPAGRGRDPIGADHERNADRLLVRDLLLHPAVLAPEQAVVRGEDHQRVVESPRVLERVEQSSDRPIDRLQRPVLVDPEGVLVGRAVGPERDHRLHVRRLVRDIRLVEGRRPPGRQVREEPFVFGRGDRRVVRRRRGVDREHRTVAPADEVLRLRGEDVGRVVLGIDPVAVHGAIDREPVLEVLGVHERHPAVPSRWT